MANVTVFVGLSILTLVFVATVLSVVFATRGAMAGEPRRGLGPPLRRRPYLGRRRCSRSCDRLRRFDPPGAQPHHAVAALRQREIVGDQHQRGAALRVPGEQELDDLAAGRLVEIAGRLVGDQDRRIRRERAGERDALLLAAGELGRIVVEPVAQADRGKLRAARSNASGAPASSSGTATFSSAVMVGIRWNDWNTMPTWRPRKRASASSSSRPRSSPATATVPVSGRSSPAATISRVDLPEPDGPTRPTASPVPICRSMSLRICDTCRAPAEREVDAGKPDRPAGMAIEVSFMRSFVAHPARRKPPVIWEARAVGPAFRLGIIALTCFGFFAAHVDGGAAAERPVRIVVLGDSLSAGFGLAAPDALPAKLERALKAKGIAVAIENAGVSGDTAGRRPCAARLVGRRRHRRGDPRARRQRCAARHRPEGDARGARSHHPAAEGAAHRGAARRHAGAAQFRAGLCAGVRRDLSGARGRARPHPLSLHSRGVAGDRRSTRPTASIRPRPAWT